MLRASLFAMSLVAFAAAPSAFAGPLQHHQPARHMPRVMAAAPGVAAFRPVRPAVRPVARVRPVLVGYPQPFIPYYGSGRTILIGGGAAAPSPQDVTVTLNPIPVVMGIRRAPEAAPVIYRIAPDREGYRMQRRERRRMAHATGVRQFGPDTTTPRIIIVRGGHGG